MKRKGSLSLSVNAIVVLILAIVMLGLGLGFVRGMFGKVSAQIEQQIASEPEPSSPSGYEPITLSRESTITRAKDKVIIKVSVYNPSNIKWDEVIPIMDCSTMGQGFKTPIANPKNIEQGKYVTFNLLVDIPSNLGPDTHLCQIKIKDHEEYEKDLTIKIIE